MSIHVTDSAIQAAEQYVIRAKRQEQQKQEQQVQQLQEIDTYDKENPVGEEAEGIYSVSHDESGNLKVSYVQPASKSSESEKVSQEKSEKTEAKTSGAGAATSATSSSDDDDNEEELQKLEQQKNALQQQINREQNEDVKAQLRNQLMAIEAEIIQLKTNS